MIDLHSHLLPGVDDGPRSMNDALALARAVVDDGIRVSVVTPHVYPGVFDNRLSDLWDVYHAYRQALADAGIPLNVYLGGEVHLHPDIFDMLDMNELPMIGRWEGQFLMLLEFPDGTIPAGAEMACRSLLDRGIRCLIAHPERNKAVMRNPAVIRPFLDLGCLLQVTAASVIGAFGRSAARTAQYLLSHGLVHVVSTDAHNIAHRPPRLADARAHLMSAFGMGMAYRLTEENPALILEGRGDNTSPIAAQAPEPPSIPMRVISGNMHAMSR